MTKAKRILFIGDSITEWGRLEDPEQLGENYVRIIHDYLRVTYPESKFEIINKGIGGNRVTDLASRWQDDVIALSPDIVSISIGINDVWRQVDQPEMEQVYPDKFEQVYDGLLAQLKAETNATIVLMEPTVIGEEIDSSGNEMLIPYVQATHKLVEKYQTKLVPTHEVFLDYLKKNTNYNLTIDGVHMNSAGNMLMAKSWLQKNAALLDK